MTDWGRWRNPRIECTSLAGHRGASQHIPCGNSGDHCINCQVGVIVPWAFEGRGFRQPYDIQWALPRFRAKILFYFLLYFIAFFLMLFSFKDSVPRQDYDTPPAVVSGRKILIPLRFDWRGEMEVAWFSPKLFKAVILNRAGYRNLNFSSGTDSEIAYVVQKSLSLIFQSSFAYGTWVCCSWNKKWKLKDIWFVKNTQKIESMFCVSVNLSVRRIHQNFWEVGEGYLCLSKEGTD